MDNSSKQARSLPSYVKKNLVRLKWMSMLTLSLIILFTVHSCDKISYASINMLDDVTSVIYSDIPNGQRITTVIGEKKYNMDLTLNSQSQSFTVTNEEGEIGLMAASTTEGDFQNMFVLYEDSKFAPTALNLSNREFIAALLSQGNEFARRFTAPAYLRMLPSEKSNGEIIVVTEAGDVGVVMMDNNPSGGSGGGCGGGPDSMSNACKAAAEDWRDCKKEIQGDGDCSDEEAEARLRCMMETGPNVGNFGI